MQLKAAINQILNISIWSIENNERGIYYLEKGEYKKAIKYFDNAIELDSNYSNAYFNRGAAYIKLGMYQDAINNLDKVLELNNSDLEAYKHRARSYYQVFELTPFHVRRG